MESTEAFDGLRRLAEGASIRLPTRPPRKRVLQQKREARPVITDRRIPTLGHSHIYGRSELLVEADFVSMGRCHTQSGVLRTLRKFGHQRLGAPVRIDCQAVCRGRLSGPDWLDLADRTSVPSARRATPGSAPGRSHDGCHAPDLPGLTACGATPPDARHGMPQGSARVRPGSHRGGSRCPHRGRTA